MSGDEGSVALEAALISADCAAMLCDAASPGRPIRFVNAAFTTLTGYSAEEAVGRSGGFLQGPGTDPRTVAEIREALNDGVPLCRDLLNYRKDGRPFWNRLTVTPIRGRSGEIDGFAGLIVDCTADHARDCREASAAPLPGVLENIPGYVYRRVLKPDGSHVLDYVSAWVSRFLGTAVDGDVGRFLQHVHPDDRGDFLSGLETSARDLAPSTMEFRLVSPSNAVRWLRSESTPERQPNGDIVWDGVALDVTAEKTSAAPRSGPGPDDQLTGLGHRDTFRSRLRAAVERASFGAPIVVVFIDLDDFQDINEARGEAVGDEALREIARRLSMFAAGAHGSVARIGGDQFAVLTPLPPAPGSVETIARALCDLVRKPVVVDGEALAVRGSAGVSVYPASRLQPPAPGCDIAGEVMKQADLALQNAKQEDPGDFRVYDARIDQGRRNRVALRQSLDRALAEDQFELHYQPFVAIHSGAIAGAEALLRWKHPSLGLQTPETFIPLAESSGLIVPMGDWILRQAMRQGAAWRRQGLWVERIAINLSSVQLRRRLHRPDFLGTVERALADTGADPRDFEFELTEGAVIESSVEIISILRALKAMGFGIAIDDFGTGHANFRYLRDLLFDKVKVDRSFITGIGEDGDSEAIVSAMIRLTRMLGAKVVGEGVESVVQRDFLHEHGCDFGQGYLFSPPVTAAAFGAMVEQRSRLPIAHGERVASRA